MRLGQILVGAGVVDAEQVSAALRQQVVYGGRLGTNIIELGYADADQIARALARQHGVPAALRRHLERHDHDVLSYIPAALASRLQAFPVAFSVAGGDRRLVVCMRDPANPAALDLIREQVGLDIVPCVAPELLMFALLERFYGVSRPRRMAHAQHGRTKPLPGSQSGPIAVPPDDSVDIDFDGDNDGDTQNHMSALQLVDLDDEGVVRDLSVYSAPPKERSAGQLSSAAWSQVTAESASVAAAAAAAAAQAIAAASSSAPTPRGLEASLTLVEALEDIDSADHRDEVSAAVVGYMRGVFGGGLALLAKDGLGLGVAGFGGRFDDDTVHSIVVPLETPSVFQRAHDDQAIYRGAPSAEELDVEERFFALFDDIPPGEVAIVPVVIRDRVVCLYYAHGDDGGALDDDGVDGLVELAEHAGEAFVRLIRGAKRR